MRCSDIANRGGESADVPTAHEESKNEPVRCLDNVEHVHGEIRESTLQRGSALDWLSHRQVNAIHHDWIGVDGSEVSLRCPRGQ